jgi:hypothetical protein
MTTKSLMPFMMMSLAALLAMPAFAADDSPLLETFDTRYEDIIDETEKGKLSDSAAARARDLRLAVKKDLIFLDAQIQAYQLEVKETSGDRQDQAIQHIIDLSAKRERLLIDAVHKLDRISDGAVTDIPVTSTVEQGRLDAEHANTPRGSGSIRMSIDAEDITDPSWD